MAYGQLDRRIGTILPARVDNSLFGDYCVRTVPGAEPIESLTRPNSAC